MLIKFKKSLNSEEREYLKLRLRNILDSDTIFIFDVALLMEITRETFSFLELFAFILTAISLILSFFLILVSFASNIRENAWEFGALRAIGISFAEITRCYIYEALALIVAAGLIGTIIGITTASTLTL